MAIKPTSSTSLKKSAKIISLSLAMTSNRMYFFPDSRTGTSLCPGLAGRAGLVGFMLDFWLMLITTALHRAINAAVVAKPPYVIPVFVTAQSRKPDFAAPNPMHTHRNGSKQPRNGPVYRCLVWHPGAAMSFCLGIAVFF